MVNEERIPANVNELLRHAQQRTPARILVGRAGLSYPTSVALSLRVDHAAARDAVRTELELDRDLAGLDLFAVSTLVRDKHEYLLRPDLGRRLNESAKRLLEQRCSKEVDLQIVVGDGLSADAVRTQVPKLLPLLQEQAKLRGWSLGQPFFVKYCRVGVLNDVGESLQPMVAVLLIGERPGLATSESLSAYFAFRPRPGDTDANRNLISNVHDQGVTTFEAVNRIIALVEQIRRVGSSGFQVKETWSSELDHQDPNVVQIPPT